jgi:hypothetical protein
VFISPGKVGPVQLVGRAGNFFAPLKDLATLLISPGKVGPVQLVAGPRRAGQQPTPQHILQLVDKVLPSCFFLYGVPDPEAIYGISGAALKVQTKP